MKDKRVIAVYLPQYHPFKENDEWWGKGFTEWRNVVTAKPRFKGHYEPRISFDLGFYDLRVADTREEQARLAKEYGIDGFCVYHYWFNGHQLMQRPMEEVLATGKPDFPFMLCWANENWSRAWDGRDKEILIKQEYSLDDDRQHIRFLIDHYFKDPRYIRVDGKPVFVIYRSSLFPDMAATIRVFRDEAAKDGMELYICRFDTLDGHGAKYLDAGFDAAIDFQPHYIDYFAYDSPYMRRKQLMQRFKYKFQVGLPFSTILDYGEYVDYMLRSNHVDYKRYPCVTPMWDNSPRRVGKAFYAFKDSTPEKFGHWFGNVYTGFEPFSKEENFVFINAWNEWAEGNYLEPDMKWGRRYLEEVSKIVQS